MHSIIGGNYAGDEYSCMIYNGDTSNRYYISDNIFATIGIQHGNEDEQKPFFLVFHEVYDPDTNSVDHDLIYATASAPLHDGEIVSSTNIERYNNYRTLYGDGEPMWTNDPIRDLHYVLYYEFVDASRKHYEIRRTNNIERMTDNDVIEECIDIIKTVTDNINCKPIDFFEIYDFSKLKLDTAVEKVKTYITQRSA